MEKLITGRPQRNRRHSRRAWPPEDDLHHMRPAKRLFTPDIKRMLKDWLVRRRENPYPSREEKKRLAIDTGLTYTQICNWFANWRRKLKNSERERTRKGSWGHLIKHYNTNAKGNVEQFSISSEDSIWEEEECCAHVDDFDVDGKPSEDDTISNGTDTTLIARKHCYLSVPQRARYYVASYKPHNGSNAPAMPQINRQLNTKSLAGNQQSYGTGNETTNASAKSTIATTFNTAKYKQKMMEKYLRDTHMARNNVEQQHQQPKQQPDPQHESQIGSAAPPVITINTSTTITPGDTNGTELSKWLESAARFTPDKNNYFIEWNAKTGKLERKQRNKQLRRITIIPAHTNLNARSQQQLQQSNSQNSPTQLELDAAEALANLAFNCRQRMLDVTTTAVTTMPTINAISS